MRKIYFTAARTTIYGPDEFSARGFDLDRNDTPRNRVDEDEICDSTSSATRVRYSYMSLVLIQGNRCGEQLL